LKPSPQCNANAPGFFAAIPVYPPSRPAILQPYPPSPYHIMNPTYPINGTPSPFTQQHHHHPSYPPQSSPSINPNGAASHITAHAPQYAAYPVHPSAYPPPHPYSHYPQYHQPMMMYPAPRTSAPPDTPQSLPSPSLPSASASGQKRKRKPDGSRGKTGDRTSDDEVGASGSDVTRTPLQPAQQPVVDVKKRTKTVCGACGARY